MKSHLVKLVTLACLVALVGCGKKRTRRAEVVECSSISLDSKGTTLCLVQLYKWKLPDAQKAAQARSHELDSLKTWQEDSVWNLGAAKHKHDFQNCRRGSEQLNNCLLVAGWPLRRVRTTTDSMWNAELPAHRRELRSEEHTSELQSQSNLVCRLLLEKKKKQTMITWLACLP